MHHRILVAFAVLAFQILPAMAVDQQLTSPSLLHDYRDFYDGRTVVVKGYAILVPHSHILLESRKVFLHEDAYRGGKDFKYCLTIVNRALLYDQKHQDSPLTKHTLILEGTFVAHYLDRVVDLGGCGGDPALLVRKIVKVED